VTRLSFVIGLIAAAYPLHAGDVDGQLLITKRLTKKAVTPTVYDLRGAATPAVPMDSAVNEFDRVIVMVEGGNAPSKQPETITINQRNTSFDPDLAVIPVGSTVEFPNWDPIFHNVFSLSGAKSFDLGFYPQGQSRTVKFTHSGVVQVYCHIHSNMYAAIVVTSSPWYGRPSADGTFSFHDVPAGHYRITAWHKIAGLYRTGVDVPGTGNVSVKLRIPIDVGSRETASRP